MFNSLELRVLATLAYSHLFKFPLTKDELEQRLIATHLISPFAKRVKSYRSSVSASYDVTQALKDLEKKDLILEQHNFWLLAEANKQWVEQRQLKKTVFQKKLAEIKPLLTFIKKIQLIRAIGLTGSMAMESPNEADDTDLILVTSNSGLWLARLLILIYTFIKDKRKDWCFNLWLTSGQLTIIPPKRNLYTAYEASQINWIYDLDGIRHQFIEQNQWVSQYLPNFSQIKQSWLWPRPRATSRSGVVLWQGLANLLNPLVSVVQRSHLTSRVGIPAKNLSQTQAILHGHAYGEQVLTNWRRTVLNLLQ